MNDEADKMIREALAREERGEFDTLSEEPSVTEYAVQMFRTWKSGMVRLAFFFTLLCSFLMFLCLYKFTFAATTHTQIGWAMGFLYFALSVAMLKMWSWGELRRLTLLRELKRFELRLALMHEQSESQED